MKPPAGPRHLRADAERNVAAILDAAVDRFSQRPDVSMGEIASAAGVGRVTLYAHFPSREGLLEEAMDHALRQTVTALDAARLGEGAPSEALGRMVRSSWSILDRHRGLLFAIGAPSPSRIREHHHEVLDRVASLLARGQLDGTFRSDLPIEWLVAVAYSLFHAAALEVSEGRLASEAAAPILEATLMAALRPVG